MLILNSYENFLKSAVSLVEIFTYTISVILISLSVVYSAFISIYEYKNIQQAFEDSRLILGESIALALSFILAVEILKIFYIKTYKQLVIIVALTLLKLTINYFLLNDIDKTIKKKSNIITNFN
jgi:uncharacterized membrane protein